MHELRNHERRFSDRKRKAFRQMELALLNVQNPVTHVLQEYTALTDRGFDGDTLANSLRLLKLALQARGQRGRVYKDLTLPELD